MTKQADPASSGGKDLLRQVAVADIAGLMAIWRGRERKEWSGSPQVYQAIGQAMLGHGEPLLAHDVISEGLTVFPRDVRLRQLQSLALARSGATEKANEALEKLQSEGLTDEETLGILARTYKDLAAQAGAGKERAHLLGRAADTYAQAFAGSGGYWSGINAATMNLLIGKTERARELAQRVREECSKAVSAQEVDEYWPLAALGEASLILEEWAPAEEWYSRAARAGSGRHGDLHSTRRNARLILEHWDADPATIDKHLWVPPVIVFVGHMIDRVDRREPRFPPEAEADVAREMRARLAKLRPAFGFASAACGSDIIFLEAMLELGAEISVVLPFNREEFVRESVDFIPDSNWGERFDRVLEEAAYVITASTHRLEVGGVSYEFCNQLLLGLGAIRSHQLETNLLPLAVWNRREGDGPGGASSVVRGWRKLGYEPEIIDLAEVLGGEGLRPADQYHGSRSTGSGQAESRPTDTATAGVPAQTFGSQVVSILFADAVGFSKLTEQEVPRFVDQFLGAIAQLSKKFGEGIIAKNTWGDGLYFVFADVDVAGNFALQLADLAAKTKWSEKGLRGSLNLRIALHAGPAYEFTDPITGSRTFSGTHVSRAARLEPITPPGQVYASETFAALAAAHRGCAFTCDYVGQTPMAKGYGTLPAYHVRPRPAGGRY